MSEIVKGFKVFNPDWTCSPNGNTKQYTCPGKFEEDVTPVRCGQGMHFCKEAADCFNYYSFNPDNHVAEVAAYGTVVEEGDKCATDKLEIIREIPWTELLEMVNMGKGCTGLCNSGNRNSGDCNSGDWLNSEPRYLMNQIQGDILEWVYLSDMTDEEKAAHPEAETTGGYLKELDNSECAVIWWRSLNQRQKNVIMAIPNFDKAIFKEITGIDVDAN